MAAEVAAEVEVEVPLPSRPLKRVIWRSESYSFRDLTDAHAQALSGDH